LATPVINLFGLLVHNIALSHLLFSSLVLLQAPAASAHDNAAAAWTHVLQHRVVTTQLQSFTVASLAVATGSSHAKPRYIMTIQQSSLRQSDSSCEL
jgi:hypothetical protein